jgi:hypothetical protein
MKDDLEKLVKDIGPDLGMFIARWAAQQEMGIEQEALSTLVVRRVREKLRDILNTAPVQPVGLRAWHQLTDAERKEWNHGVMDPEAGRRVFQTYEHAYRLITGYTMPAREEAVRAEPKIAALIDALRHVAMKGHYGAEMATIIDKALAPFVKEKK